MQSMRFKTSISSQGCMTGAHPAAPVGPSRSGDVIVYEVTDIPDGVQMAEVLLRFSRVVLALGLYRARYDQLTPGAYLTA